MKKTVGRTRRKKSMINNIYEIPIILSLIISSRTKGLMHARYSETSSLRRLSNTYVVKRTSISDQLLISAHAWLQVNS